MRSKPTTGSAIWAVSFLILAAAPAVHAYIDAGTGSYMLQLLIAGLFAGGFAVKIYWKKIIGLFGSKRSDDEEDRE